MIGTFKGSGFKFGRWLDTVLMQKALNGGDANAAGRGRLSGHALQPKTKPL
jgi:hypothetical protein